jgi:YVTN family beta-propeller protein
MIVTSQPTGTVTLLFSDIEGSTRLLQRLGRERYAEAVELHRRRLREAFARHEGFEVDSEGDSFFVAFARAADAVAAAGDAQAALAAASWPADEAVRVRVGVHTGEPLVEAPRYVGAEVHKAARIMAAAHGGQVLVSESTRRLLDDREELHDRSLLDLGLYRLKDFDEPARLYELRGPDLAERFPPPRAQPVARPRRRLLATAFALAVAVAGAVTVLLLTRGPAGGVKVAADSVAVIDPASNRVVASVSLGSAPTAITTGAGDVWTASATDGTLARIDPKTATLLQTLAPPAPPGQVAVGSGSVWIESQTQHGLRISRLELANTTLSKSLLMPLCGFPVQKNTKCVLPVGLIRPAGIAISGGSLWAVGDWGNTDYAVTQLWRLDPTRARILSLTNLVVNEPAGIALGGGAVWMPGTRDAAVWSVNSLTDQAQKVTVGGEPTAVAYGAGSAWVTTASDNAVWRVDAASTGTVKLHGSVGVGQDPVAVAYGDGAVWVANHDDGTLSRVDPHSDRVTSTIHLGQEPVAVTVTAGRVWVAVQGAPPPGGA